MSTAQMYAGKENYASLTEQMADKPSQVTSQSLPPSVSSQAEIDAVYMMLGDRIARLTSQLLAELAQLDTSAARHTLAHLDITQRIQNKMIANLHLFPATL